MKKILTISFLFLAGVILLASCTKRDYYEEPPNERETAFVDYFYEDYPFVFIVQFQRDGRYAVVTTLNEDEYLPIIDEELVGNFGLGKKSIFVIDGNFYARMDVLETNIRTQAEADDALAYWVDNDPYNVSAVMTRSKPKPDVKSLQLRKR
ncbi:hypothetical protein ABDK00_005820 [Niabella insulamsoli]|uniref:hypothetical protein n=1 Tax=Niabella insulamsoli TaxID=3144874 RepID=UPI0031FCF857